VPAVCKICSHAKRKEIENAFLAGTPRRAIARQWSLSRHSVDRHGAAHISAKLAKAEILDAEALMLKVQGYIDVAERTVVDAGAKTSDVLAAIREARACVAMILEAAHGKLNQRTINVYTSPEFITVRTVIVDALAPYPEARQAVAARLIAMEDSSSPTRKDKDE